MIMGVPKLPKIKILIPYFGRWPSYMPVYLNSAARNSHLDILLITDIRPSFSLPSNVSILQIEFDDLLQKIRQRLNLEIPAIKPYKLCDFRPAYGLIFEDILKGVDFWGYSDIDLIYGKTDLFITSEILNQYDILSFKKGHIHGPFSLYRNTYYINHLFEKGEVYKQVFCNPEYCSFDEFGKNVFYVHLKSEEDIFLWPKDNISVIAAQEHIQGSLKLYQEQHVKEDLSLSDIVAYDRGRVYDYRTKKDYFFYHWVLDKRAVWFKYPKWFINPPDKFYISTTGFYTRDEFRFYFFLHCIRLSAGFLYWFGLKCLNFAKRRLGMKVVLDTYPRIGWVKYL